MFEMCQTEITLSRWQLTKSLYRSKHSCHHSNPMQDIEILVIVGSIVLGVGFYRGMSSSHSSGDLTFCYAMVVKVLVKIL